MGPEEVVTMIVTEVDPSFLLFLLLLQHLCYHTTLILIKHLYLAIYNSTPDWLNSHVSFIYNYQFCAFWAPRVERHFIHSWQRNRPQAAGQFLQTMHAHFYDS